MATHDLQLYYRPTCPYCQKVLRHMQAYNIELPLHDISSSEEDRTYLLEHGGRQQVPCLFIDGEALYESDDIIDYLKTVFSE